MPLSKSRFIQGISCPNKLYYSLHKDLYANRNITDPFLKSIAKGGFQVEALAKSFFPSGVMNPVSPNEYELSSSFTIDAFQKENCVLFEAGFLADNLYALSDIVVKKGNQVQLIEVKAKSYNSQSDSIFLNKNGTISAGWKPYLFDLAFQKELALRCFPNLKVEAKLFMPDKAKTATVNGLNQLIRIPNGNVADLRKDIILKFSSIEELGEPIMGFPDGVDEIVDDIRAGKHLTDQGLTFHESIDELSSLFTNPRYQTVNTALNTCKKCPYNYDGSEESFQLRSGLEECLKDRFGLSAQQVKEPTILNIWNFRGADKLAQSGKILMRDVDEDDMNVKLEPGRMSNTERQWLQISKSKNNDNSPFVDYENLGKVMNQWKFPLHFIDFETSSAAIPFMKGMVPYENVIFQFSHHLVDEKGEIKHQSEYLHAIPGVFPNFEVVRKLKEALSGDQGTIFRYHNHENTILNSVRLQLLASDETDKIELAKFIESISSPTKDANGGWEVGDRNMVDLAELIRWFYYEPITNGRNSLKDYLPAIMNSSRFLQGKYSEPIGSIGLSSKNFPKDWRWFESSDKKHSYDPYKRLPKLFEKWSIDELDILITDMEDINNGGAAMIAYAVLQYQEISDVEREALQSALLKYCELDTLAMVMIYEGLKSHLSISR